MYILFKYGKLKFQLCDHGAKKKEWNYVNILAEIQPHQFSYLEKTSTYTAHNET